MTPKISIILSIFKPNLDHLKKTIESIQAQTFSDYEIIIIKDDDEDSTLEVINKVTMKLKNFILIDNSKNIGLVASLNKGLLMAKGEYIARIDVGDWWHHEKLKIQYRKLIKDNLVLIGTQVNFFSTDLEIIKQHQVPILDSEIRVSLENGKNPFVHSSVLFKKIENVFYNENAVHTEDFELWCRYYFFGKMSNLSFLFTNYIVDMQSITSSKRFLMYVNATDVYINFLKYINKADKQVHNNPYFIDTPKKTMNYFEKYFSYYFSLANYERLNSFKLKFLIYIIFAFLFKPQVLGIFLKRKIAKLYYKIK